MYYSFMDQRCQTLNELGLLFQQNFDAAKDSIFKNTKKFIKFVKKCDKKLAKEVVDVIVSTKYKGNVVTFLIFMFCDDPVVVINGVNLDFNQFIEIVGRNRDNVAIKAFIEDFGITKTYAKLNIDKKLATDSYFIEKSFDEDFTYKYLSSYLKIDYTENLNGYISNLFIYDEEKFRRALKIVKNEGFLMTLAHKTNFKSVYEATHSSYPIFEILKLLRVEFDENDLLKVVNDSHFYWMFDNFDKYNYHKTVKDIKEFYSKLKKEYQGKKNKDFAYEMDVAEKLYNEYLLFVAKYKEGLIKVNTKKYDERLYVLDKPYCATLITTDYMKTHPVKLATAEVATEEEHVDIEYAKEVNLETERDKEFAVDEEEVALEEVKTSKEITKEEIAKYNKIFRKQKRFTSFALLASFFITILTGLAVALYFLPENILQPIRDILAKANLVLYPKKFQDDIIYIGAVGGGLFVAIILAVIINTRRTKANDRLSDYLNLMQGEKGKGKNTAAKQKKLEKILNDVDGYKKKIYRPQIILTTLLMIIVATMHACGVYVYINFITEVFSNEMYKYLALGVPAGVALLYGIIRRKKGAMTMLFIDLIAYGVAVTFLYVLK